MFALADFGISAGAAYRELDRQRAAGAAPPGAGRPDALLAALAAGDLDGVAAALANDLQPAALELAPALPTRSRPGAGTARWPASSPAPGPTCAFLCRDEAAAARRSRPSWRPTACAGPRASPTARYPAPGW